MNKIFQVALLILAALITFSCAVSYHPIKPESYYYSAAEIDTGISYSFKYDVLRSSENNRYADKEIVNGMRILAVQITNTSDTIIRLSRDYNLYVGNIKTLPLNARAISNRLNQNVPSYYWYLLLTFTQLNYQTPTTSGSIPIGLVLGPLVTAINVTKASSANKSLYLNLYEKDIWNTDIQKGETMYGLIGIESRDVAPIRLKKK